MIRPSPSITGLIPLLFAFSVAFTILPGNVWAEGETTSAETEAFPVKAEDASPEVEGASIDSDEEVSALDERRYVKEIPTPFKRFKVEFERLDGFHIVSPNRLLYLKVGGRMHVDVGTVDEDSEVEEAFPQLGASSLAVY